MNPSIPYYPADNRPYTGYFAAPGNMPYYPTPYTGIFPAFVSQAGFSFSEDALYKDMDYMKQLYPKAVKHIQKEIDEECDRLEYEGSFMFDDYPDPVRLQVMADSIYGRLKDTGFGKMVCEMSISEKEADIASTKQKEEPEETPDVSAKQLPVFYPSCGPGRYCPPPEPDYRPDGTPNWLRSLIQIMLCQEMLHRRKRYRDRRRWY